MEVCGVMMGTEIIVLHKVAGALMAKLTTGLQPLSRKECFAIVFQCPVHHGGINQYSHEVV